jgi:eukaryotic translation initiation factor 2C
VNIFLGSYKPQITFIVVQKRHHTRLFPANPKDSEDRNMNVPAGTCVDTIITHPTALEYYLVSHASIQGVARPTKYRLLWDDANMEEEELQNLTYYLCHMFSRCTRSVSYPAPTYYAHLAAARAKVYCDDKNLNLDRLSDEQRKLVIKDVIVKGTPMFFV